MLYNLLAFCFVSHLNNTPKPDSSQEPGFVFRGCLFMNRSLSSRQTKKQKILLKMVSVICRGHLFMQHPASYGNSLVRGNLDDADAVGSCSNE